MKLGEVGKKFYAARDESAESLVLTAEQWNEKNKTVCMLFIYLDFAAYYLTFL